ncbi:MAG: type I restriction endonuclease subunit R [Verrucomicrobia bacterium]|nr:type I restriction endonuclease subunit R [Verrucomicrobiota bacterium]
MPKTTSEQTFENAVVADLVKLNGFHLAAPEDYDPEHCLIPKSLVRFFQVTQPQVWKDLRDQLGGEAETRIVKRVRDVIEKKGTLHVLRHGVDESGCHFELCFFPTAGRDDPELDRLCEGNFFQVLRDENPAGGFRYSREHNKSLDLGIFLNGLPLFTAELKNPVSGQDVGNAVAQYQNDRDPNEPLFRLGRCLAHFAVDTELVLMTSALDGKRTRFYPFNRGNDGGAGNTPSRTGITTAYLWREIWTKDSILDLVRRFVQLIDKLDDKGRPTGKKVQIFPRYHQLQCVREQTAHAREHGPGFSYLNQHSAGSGKTIEIATLANSLATLHDRQGNAVFNTVIVLSDRQVIDSQLQRELTQFTRTRGMLENIDQTSRQLKAALEDGKKIIVSTIQKFSVIVDDMAALKANRFAVIIDEAHSSQAGVTGGNVNRVVSYGKLEDAEDPDEETCEDKIREIMKRRGRMKHVSFFAFTATPKPETLQLFKTTNPDGSVKVPFTIYSMRQAIEEKFILDVLENLTHWNQYFHLLKKAKDDKRFDKAKATALLRQFAGVHAHAVKKKARIMVDHFREHVEQTLDGKAKAMIVTRSRLHAVRYAVAVRDYLKELGEPFEALVAFTGKVKDKDTGAEYTEAKMNGFAEDKLRQRFEAAQRKILIVANKYQTGFDQPLLKAMYVDRKLTGVAAVQTLSRLNRTHPGKESVMVLDFENEPKHIEKQFEPYYDRIKLTKEVEPSKLYDIRTELEEYAIYTPAAVDAFCEVFYRKGDSPAKLAKLHEIANGVVTQFKLMDETDRKNFKSQMRDYVKLYGFLSQIIPFNDPRLEKLYAFAGFVVKKLPAEGKESLTEIVNMTDMDHYRPSQRSSGKIALKRGEAAVKPKNYGATSVADPENQESLSKIIEALNQQFGTKFTAEDRVVIEQLEQRLGEDRQLEQQLAAGSKQAVRLSFEEVAQDLLHGLIDSNFKFYKKVLNDQEVAKELFDRLFVRYLASKKASETDA